MVHLGKETTGSCVAAPYIPLDNRLQADLHRFERVHEAQTDISVSDILFLDVGAFDVFSFIQRLIPLAQG